MNRKIVVNGELVTNTTKKECAKMKKEYRGFIIEVSAIGDEVKYRVTRNDSYLYIENSEKNAEMVLIMESLQTDIDWYYGSINNGLCPRCEWTELIDTVNGCYCERCETRFYVD